MLETIRVQFLTHSVYCINAIMFGNNNHNVLIDIVMSSAAATAAAYRMLLLSRCVAH